MKVEWTVKREAHFFLEDAYAQYCDSMRYEVNASEELVMEIIHDVINNNLVYDEDEDVPDEVYNYLVEMMKARIGGIQLRMEGV